MQVLTGGEVEWLAVGFASGVAGTLLAGAVDRLVRSVRFSRRRSRIVKGRDPVIPLPGVKRSIARQVMAMPESDVTRELVIEALRGVGFSKATATQAADACPKHARATLESWTRAALDASRGA